MSLGRSVAQQKFRDKYNKIAAQRDAEISMGVSLEFISAVSTSLAIVDMVQILGFGLSIFFSLTTPALLFYGLLAFAIACGVFCVDFIIEEGEYRKNCELNLMTENFNLKTNQLRKKADLKWVLEELLTIKEDAFIRQRYEQIDEADIDDLLAEIRGHIKLQKQKDFSTSMRRRHEKTEDLPLIRITPPNYTKSNLIAFFSGAGFMLGIVATIIGASPLSALLFTPAGIGLVAFTLLVCAAAGVVQLYVDYKMRRAQQTHIEKLEDKKFARTLTNKKLNRTAELVEDYKIILSQQNELAELKSRHCEERPLRRSNPEVIIIQGRPGESRNAEPLLKEATPFTFAAPHK